VQDEKVVQTGKKLFEDKAQKERAFTGEELKVERKTNKRYGGYKSMDELQAVLAYKLWMTFETTMNTGATRDRVATSNSLSLADDNSNGKDLDTVDSEFTVDPEFPGMNGSDRCSQDLFFEMFYL
jgi:hypothetical protein